MNREQANRISAAAINFAEATADARVWKQAYDSLTFVTMLKKRWQEAEDHRKQTHEALLIEINSAITE